MKDLWTLILSDGNFKRLSLSDVNHPLPDLATLKAENVKVETRPPGSGDVSDFTLIPRFRSKIPTVRDYLEIHLILHAASVVLTYLQWNTLTSDELCPIENRISLSAISYFSPCWERRRGEGDNAWSQDDGGWREGLVISAWRGGDWTQRGAADQNKQADNQRLTEPSRADNETGTDLVGGQPAPQLGWARDPSCWPNQKRPALLPINLWRGVCSGAAGGDCLVCYLRSL